MAYTNEILAALHSRLKEDDFIAQAPEYRYLATIADKTSSANTQLVYLA
nr:hypothetical protein [Agrobacterium genomosp. 6]